MGINNLDLISECFSDKQNVRDIINAFLEDGLDDIRSLIKALSYHGLDDSQKKELAIFYIKNRTKDGIINGHLRELICDRAITSKYKYQDLKKLLCYYVYDNSVYPLIKQNKEKGTAERAVRDVEDCIVDKLIQLEGMYHVEKNPKNRNIYKSLLYIITTNPNIFKYRSIGEIRALIYTGLKDTGRVLRKAMTDEGLLKHRSLEEQKKLMDMFMRKPYPDAEQLVLDEEILSNTTFKKQLQMLREYIENPNRETLKRARENAQKGEAPITAEDFTSEIGDGR